MGPMRQVIWKDLDSLYIREWGLRVIMREKGGFMRFQGIVEAGIHSRIYDSHLQSLPHLIDRL